MPRATRRHRALLPRDPLSMERSPAAALVSAQGAERAVRRTADAQSPPARWLPPASRRALVIPSRCCAYGGGAAAAAAAVILAVSIAAAPGVPRRSPHPRTSLAATHRLRRCPHAGGTASRCRAATLGHLCDAARSCRRRRAAGARRRHPRRRRAGCAAALASPTYVPCRHAPLAPLPSCRRDSGPRSRCHSWAPLRCRSQLPPAPRRRHTPAPSSRPSVPSDAGAAGAAVGALASPPCMGGAGGPAPRRCAAGAKFCGSDARFSRI